MTQIFLRPENNLFGLSYCRQLKASTFRTLVENQRLNVLSFKQNLKLNVSCNIKERERESVTETNRKYNGLEVNDQLEEEISDGKVGFDWDWPPWQNLPQRYQLIGTTSLAFVICNMDKVNLSVAIIPMSHQFGWNASMAGLVQSSFFWGYALSQLPGGWLAKIFGGRKVLQVGVLVWSLATALVPILAGFMPGLIFSRILVGIGEGVSPSAATDMIARLIPIEERSRAVSFVFGGLSVGSVLGLLLAPPLIQNYGWESVFYTFGILGIAWFLGFQFVQEYQPPLGAASLSWHQAKSKSGNSSLEKLGVSLREVPWKEFFKCKPVWAMIYAHFCGSWGHYTCLSWLPTFFSEELNLDLTEAAWSIITVYVGQPSAMKPTSINREAGNL